MSIGTYQGLGRAQVIAERGQRWRAAREALSNYAFVAPYLVAFLLFSVGPIAYGFYMSFFKFQILATEQPFIGLDNYRRLAADPLFRIALRNTFYFAFLTVGIETVVALLAALALHGKLRGQGLFQFIFYSPVTVSVAVVGVLMNSLIGSGTINEYLRIFKLGTFSFLGTDLTAIPTLSVVSVWWGFGFAVLVLLAGLHNIPSHIYEAAQIDGAGPLRTLFRITLPLLRPTLLFVLVILTIAHLQVFAQMFIMTHGGPGYASLSIVMYLYQNAWAYYDMGYASAIAVVLAIIMALFSGALFRLLGHQFEF
jgi:multiple sugar transport system permease protein